MRVLEKDDLLRHASDDVSGVFGASFSDLDLYDRRVRLPQPPLLLCDRAHPIGSAPSVLQPGSITTETDVAWDKWYLHEGRVPPGILIESGQGILLLLSWMGVDRLHGGTRVYRLLDLDGAFHGPLPQGGETFRSEVAAKEFIRNGDLCLLKGRVETYVGNALRFECDFQGGFFSETELSASRGVVFDPARVLASLNGPMAAPVLTPARAAFGREELVHLSHGRPDLCFGGAYAAAASHVRTPRLLADRLLSLDRITHLEFLGGPWGRGTLRSETDVRPGDWFFAAHFKNDPVLPGNLMYEACLQNLRFYLLAMGVSLDRDGAIFEPFEGERFKFQCRGQVTPRTERIVYEVFVREIGDKPHPYLRADVTATADGLRIFHLSNAGLRLVPDTPLSSRPELLKGTVEKPGVAYGHANVLASCLGRQSDAFGPRFTPFDQDRRTARLPAPPMLFLTRVTKISPPDAPQNTIECEYDVPESGPLDFTALLEAGLQPCGWLGAHIGTALTSDENLFFRNLDGFFTLHDDVRPGRSPLRISGVMTGDARMGGMVVQTLNLEGTYAGRKIFDLKTSIGWFTQEALAQQAGLPTTDTHRRALEETYEGPEIPLPSDRLPMLDRVTGFWPQGGVKGLGRVRAEKDVKPDDWFFRCHFYQDPVMPGSLGLEAMLQTVRCFVLRQDLHQGITNPRFEPIAKGRRLDYKYRGQVTPKNRKVTIVTDIVEIKTDAGGSLEVVAEATLWVDGKRIYEAKNLSVRVVAGEPAAIPEKSRRFDPAVDTWLQDHCPTFVIPTLPFTFMASMMMEAAERSPEGRGRKAVGLRDVKVSRWLSFAEGPQDVKIETDGARVSLLHFRKAAREELSRFESFATGEVILETDYPAPPVSPVSPVSEDAGRKVAGAELYRTGRLFHGPAFQLVEEIEFFKDETLASRIRNPRDAAPELVLPLLLDAVTQSLPNERLHEHFSKIAPGQVGYPHALSEAWFFGPVPEAPTLRCEIRFAGFDGNERLPAFDILLRSGPEAASLAWAKLRYVEVLLPLGRLFSWDSKERMEFARDRRFVPGLTLSRMDGGTARLWASEVKAADWLPGTIECLYGSSDPAAIAAKELLSQAEKIHPSEIHAAQEGDGRLTAVSSRRPMNRAVFSVSREGDAFCVRRERDVAVDPELFNPFLREQVYGRPCPLEDFGAAVAARFEREIVLEDPRDFERQRGRPCLYLANHQTYVESFITTHTFYALSRFPVVTLAKQDHRGLWPDLYQNFYLSYLNRSDLSGLFYVNRDDPHAMLEAFSQIERRLREGRHSVMIHAEGRRAYADGEEIQKLSGVWIDMAVNAGVPILPVRFLGGLPKVSENVKYDFPKDYGRQSVFVGRALSPEELARRPYAERAKIAREAINRLGRETFAQSGAPPNDEGDPTFGRRVAAWRSYAHVDEDAAILFEALADRAPSAVSADIRRLVEAGRLAQARGDRPTVDFPDTPEGRWFADLASYLFGR